MTQFAPFAAYLVTLVLFLVLDGIWLGVVAGGHYRSQMGALLAERFNLPAAAAFYLLYPVGLVLFAVEPGLGAAGPWRAAALAAAFGLFATARSVGLLAHGLEQLGTAQVIRPRGRYVGPVPDAAPGPKAGPG